VVTAIRCSACESIERAVGQGCQAEGVADRDAAGQAQDAGPFDDQAYLPGPELAAIVEVDVDPAVVARGGIEDGVEVPGGVVVDAGRVEAADELGAGHDRFLEQLAGARAGEQPALGEGHDLDADSVGESVPGLEDAFDARQPHFGVDVDMASDMSDAGRNVRLEQVGGPLGDGRQLAPAPTLVSDELGERRSAGVAPPGQAPECLVEVGVGVDQARQQELAIALNDLSVLGGPEAGPD
jgi:hypothetical protein